MRFFRDLFETFKGDVDLSMRIMSKDGTLTVQITSGVTNDQVKPIEITGTPPEFDEEFFAKIVPGVKEVQGLVSNIEQVKQEAAKAAEPKAKPVAAAKKEKPKKDQPKKKKSKEPAVIEPDIFSSANQAATSSADEAEEKVEEADGQESQEET